MKKFTIVLILLITTWSVNSQNERSIDELLEVLSQNHMGSVSDVFTKEEILIIKNYFNVNTTNTNNRVLLDKRYASTQSYINVQEVDIDPTDLSSVDIIGNSPITEFPGAGIHVRGTIDPPSSPRIIIIDNNGRVYERTPWGEPFTITDMGELTGIPEGHSITGIEKADDAIFGTSTNGANNTLLVRIDIDELFVTPVGENNGLVLPISLARDENNDLFTIDIDDDMLYKLDKETGAATPVGPLGYDANFGQGMFYDELSKQMISIAYNTAIGDSELRSVNSMTGLSISLGTIQPGTIQQFGWGSYFDRDELSVIDSEIEGFNFYPNPATNYIVLEAKENIESIEIFSMLGQLVHNQKLDTKQSQVDLSKLQSGNYILKVYSNKKEDVFKLLKI